MKFVFLITAMFLTGCATTATGIIVQKERKYEPVESDTFGAKTKEAEVTYIPDIVESWINFEFKNNSDKPMKIVWDESSYVDPTSTSHKVINRTTKLINKEQSVPATMVPPHAIVKDALAPTSTMSLNMSVVGQQGWEYSPICGHRNLWTKELEDDECLGKTFSFYLTYEVDGKRKTIPLKYKLVSSEKTKKKKKDKLANK